MKAENPVVEHTFKPGGGGIYLILWFLLLGGNVYIYTLGRGWPIIVGLAVTVVLLILLAGFTIVNPNESSVMTFFGTYKGTIKHNGFFYVHPFMSRKKVSLRARNLNSEMLKVNDRLGNPIEIAAVIVWQVVETAKASFEVEDFERYVALQSESAIRHLAGSYAYDNIEGDDHDEAVTLRGGTDTVNHKLETELEERLRLAGIHVLEARISHLAYAPEIAQAMLQRQQATAVVAARRQIVDGAVSMVEMALEKLSARGIVELDQERKAAMVSNLLVVLCSDRSVSPVVNAGTLHH